MKLGRESDVLVLERNAEPGKGSELEGSEATSNVKIPEGVYLRVLDGFFEGLEFGVESEWLVVGRGRGAYFVVPEPTISRAHAAVGYEDGGFFVQDLGSTNGTLLNGESRQREPLEHGDEIQIGKLRLGVILPA
ncbi:MAG: FHA domain-containing protein [Deltaproteobacteria bacterium]|nr:FHA domain-containing protein [Deltaproteobacteria bacterium]